MSALWKGVIAALLIAGVAVAADYRRNRRRDIDRVGWVPWPLILIFSLMIAALCAAIALKG